MSAFMILGKDFNPTWKEILPYVDQIKNGENTEKLFITAKKAVYAFVCTLFNRGFFKVGLDTQIKALDEENEVDGDVGGSPHIQRMNEMIEAALVVMRKQERKNDRLLITQQITAIHALGNSYMELKIGKDWLCWVKTCPSFC